MTTQDIGGIGVLQFQDPDIAQSYLSNAPCIQNQVMSFEIIPFNPIDWSKGILNGVDFICTNLRTTESDAKTI